MFTLNTRCFRYKLILATKYQNGWPGFVAPYQNRYLNRLVVITTTPANGGPSNVRQQAFILDRLTGNLISPSPGTAQADAYFPYGENFDDTWQISDAHYLHTLNNGVFIIQTEVTLSNPYTLDMLDADANALIASVNITAMPWGTLATAAYAETSIPIGPYTGNGDLIQLLPPQVTYTNLSAPGPNIIPQLNAAAWSIYAPGFVNDQNYFPNGYSKLVSYIAMAGNYCQKTYFVDYTQKLLNQTCQSGVGSCANPFQVTPPSPPTPGQNSYVLLQPNCRCDT